MSKIFRPLILSKNAITYSDDVFMQSQTKDEMLIVLEKYRQILQNKNMIAAPDKTNFFPNTRKISWTHHRKRYFNPTEIAN